jgi:catechol 2,3-dioxygenase-like lactoylglutathione lyase family enzyme
VLDHVALEVADLDRSARFYDAVIRALGGRRIVSSPNAIGYGRDRPVLWLLPAGADARPPRGHVAIAALGRRAVDAAHQAGLAAGGRDGGRPAARPFGPPTHYAGYLVDPDGAYVEVVSGGGSPAGGGRRAARAA